MRKRKRGSRPDGRWQVARERFHIEGAYPPASDVEPHAIGDIIPLIMKKLGLDQQHWLAVLAEEWPSLVGDAVAAHTRPGRFENKVLTVFVDSAVWLNELSRYGRKKMLENLQKRFGADRIADVRMQPDPGR